MPNATIPYKKIALEIILTPFPKQTFPRMQENEKKHKKSCMLIPLHKVHATQKSAVLNSSH